MPEPTAAREVWAGRYLRVTVEEWPQIGDYELIRKHHAVAVVPVTPHGDVVLVRQFRPPVRADLTEIPAGLLDIEGEDALTCAGRELFEETGYRLTVIEFLGGFYASPGSSDHYVHLFWAETAAHPDGEPEEGIEVVLGSMGDLVAAAKNGKIRDVKTAMALLLADARPRPTASG